MTKRRKMIIEFAACLLWAGLLGAVDEAEQKIQDAIVKLTVTRKGPSYNEPWLMEPQSAVSGSGCIITGNRVLTNAHMVSDQVFIQVQRSGDTSPYTAEVEYVGHDCDLALLKVNDPVFFGGVKPLEMGDLPPLRSSVSVYGFPRGGDKLSVTTGVVSRIEVGRFLHSGHDLLRLQIDAAVNPGNSGGAVISSGRLVGIAFAANRSDVNVGFAVPRPVIEHFMADIADGRYDGMPFMGIKVQKVENPAMREALGMPGKRGGVRVSVVYYGTSADGILLPDDVLLEIAGIPVASDGTVPIEGIGQVDFCHVIHKFQIGETIPLRLLRSGREFDDRVTLRGIRTLVPLDRYDVRPTYFTFAGLVFQPETKNYLLQWEDYGDIPADLRYFFSDGRQTATQQEIVLLTKVLPHAVNIGYHDLEDEVVTQVNGHHIGSMSDLIAALERPSGKFDIISLSDGKKVILDAVESRRVSAEIMKRFQVPADRSEDLRKAEKQ